MVTSFRDCRVRNNLHDFEYVRLLRRKKHVLTTHSKRLTAPFTAKSSPRYTVVATATKSFIPVGVLRLSRVMHSSAFTNSFAGNSNLGKMNSYFTTLCWGQVTHPSIVAQSPGEMSSNVEHSMDGSPIFGAERSSSQIESGRSGHDDSPSGLQRVLPSSSNITNGAFNDAAATISPVDAS